MAQIRTQDALRRRQARVLFKKVYLPAFLARAKKLGVKIADDKDIDPVRLRETTKQIMQVAESLDLEDQKPTVYPL